MAKVHFFKATENVKTYDALVGWAESSNVHIDEIRLENNSGLMYYSYKYPAVNGEAVKKLASTVIWDKVKGNVWCINLVVPAESPYNDLLKCIWCNIDSKEYKQLAVYTMKQFQRLAQMY
jgi:hypothetical protein